MKMIVTDEQAQWAIKTMNTLAEEFEAAKMTAISSEHNRKTLRAGLFLDAEGSVGVRESTAEASEVYKTACDFEAEAVARWEGIRARIRACEATLEVWRTSESSRRKMTTG